MTLAAVPAGQSAGKVARQTREKTGAAPRAADAKSGAPARLLTFQAVAEQCSVSIWTVRAWVDAGRLPVLRLPGRLVRVHPADLATFLEACR